MVVFSRIEDKIIFEYAPDHDQDNWMVKAINEDGELSYKRTFFFNRKSLYSLPDADATVEFPDEPEPIKFVFAKRTGAYFKIVKGVLDSNYNIFIHRDIPFDIKYFVAEKNISILGKMLGIVQADLYIGGEMENAIPADAYKEMITRFPNSYERSLYAAARISATIRQYIEMPVDKEKQLHKYLNKKSSRKGTDLISMFRETEVLKYQTILKKMEVMLASEDEYNGKQWQEEILQIIRLLYPKYILAFREVPVTVNTTRYLDYMLVDASGHVDIVEIKKPGEHKIITKATYRDNYIPLRELSGTIMQIEKYIFYLNRSADKLENMMTEKYKGELPEGFTIKITNPSGIIIMGRDHTLSIEQKMDFEVVKRKYKNVIDIITYDELLQRLRFIIEQIKKI